jgi:hypothetical protein
MEMVQLQNEFRQLFPSWAPEWGCIAPWLGTTPICAALPWVPVVQGAAVLSCIVSWGTKFQPLPPVVTFVNVLVMRACLA